MIHLSTTMPLMCLLNRTRPMFREWRKIKHVLSNKFYFHESGTTMVEISTITISVAHSNWACISLIVNM